MPAAKKVDVAPEATSDKPAAKTEINHNFKDSEEEVVPSPQKEKVPVPVAPKVNMEMA